MSSSVSVNTAVFAPDTSVAPETDVEVEIKYVPPCCVPVDLKLIDRSLVQRLCLSYPVKS